MKKSIVIVLVLLMMLSLVACGETENKPSTTTTTETNTTITTTQPTTQQTTTKPQETDFPVGKIADGVDEALGQEIRALIDGHYAMCMSGIFECKVDYADRDGLIDVKGKTYIPVTLDSFSDFQSLEDTVKSLYNEDAARYFLQYYCYGEPLYSELDGQLVMRWHPQFDGDWYSDYKWSEYIIEKIETDGDKGTVTFLVKYPEIHGSIAYYVDNEGNRTPDDRRYNHERVEAPIVLCDGGWRLTSINEFYGEDYFLVEE